MRLRDCITLMIVFSVLFAMVVKALQEANDTADVIACKNNLKTLVQGVAAYEDTQEHLPPLRVVGYPSLPGWNTRLLPFIGYPAVHEQIVTNGVYTLDIVSLTSGNLASKKMADYRYRVAWDKSADALATVSEYRCATRTPEPVVKHKKGGGVTTDYAAPLVFTNYRTRYVTLRMSIWDAESPLMIYELNTREGTWFSVRKTEDWLSGTSNVLLMSEKHIPDWTLTDDSQLANFYNGGLHQVINRRDWMEGDTWRDIKEETCPIAVFQGAAQCYWKSRTPIVQDGEEPIAQDSILNSRVSVYPGLHRGHKPSFRGNHAWGSHHVGVITAAMGDGSVRSINKDMAGSVFYALAASNVLPEPTEEEKQLAEEEAEAIQQSQYLDSTFIEEEEE